MSIKELASTVISVSVLGGHKIFVGISVSVPIPKSVKIPAIGPPVKVPAIGISTYFGKGTDFGTFTGVPIPGIIADFGIGTNI
jgi:hypothetical protein